MGVETRAAVLSGYVQRGCVQMNCCVEMGKVAGLVRPRFKKLPVAISSIPSCRWKLANLVQIFDK